jgi:hypothetical protein
MIADEVAPLGAPLTARAAAAIKINAPLRTS